MASIKKFIYVHILKTAGTTLRHSVFEKHYKGRYLYDGTFKHKYNSLVEVAQHPVIIEPQPFPRKDYKKFDVIFGHFKHDKYAHLNRPMFSFIRHPVTRLIDQYYYHAGFYNHEYSIQDFAEEWANHMSYVLGDISKYEFIGVVEKINPSLKIFCKKLGIPTVQNPKKKRYFNDDKIRKTSKAVKRYIAQANKEDMELYKEISGRIK